MNLSTYLGVSGLIDVGYRFYNADESANGARVTAGVVDAGSGWYSVDATIPINAVSVRWDSTGTADAFAREYFFQVVYPGTGIGQVSMSAGIVQAKISEGTGTGQLSLDAGKVKISEGTGAGQLDLVSGGVKICTGGMAAVSFETGAISTNAFAAGAITNAVFAAETGLRPARAGTAQGGGVNYITLDAGASAVDDFFKNGIALLTGGTGAGTFAVIQAYDGLTKNATTTTPFVVSPDATTTFAILPMGGIATSAPTAEDIADAVASRVIAATAPASESASSAAASGSAFDFTGASLNLYGVAGNDLSMDVYFHSMDLTGYVFEGYIILEPAPLEKRYALTVTPTDLASGQINVSLTETQTAEIGPITGKPWYIRWDGGATSVVRNLLMGKVQLNRF